MDGHAWFRDSHNLEKCAVCGLKRKPDADTPACQGPPADFVEQVYGEAVRLHRASLTDLCPFQQSSNFLNFVDPDPKRRARTWAALEVLVDAGRLQRGPVHFMGAREYHVRSRP